MDSEPPDKNRSIKTSLESVMRDTTNHPLTKHLVVSIMNVLCEEGGYQETRDRQCNPGTLLLKQELLAFHREHYKSTMENPEENLGFANKAQLFQYIAVDVVKDYENNIKLHFVQHLNRFLDVVYNKSEVMATKDEQARTQLFADLRAARDFVLFQPEASNKRVRLSHPVEAPVVPSRLAEVVLYELMDEYRVREVQRGGEPTPLDARGLMSCETGCSVAKTAWEQGSQRVAQHHAPKLRDEVSRGRPT